MSSTLLNDSSQVYNVGAVSTRNAFASVVSIAISLVSGMLIIVTRLKRPLKILLLNQVACDIFLMASIFTYATSAQMDVDSSNLVCLVVVYLMIYGFILCHASLAAISMNNFLAIFFPYKYNITVTTKNVLFIIIILWVGFAIISLGCVGIEFEPGLPCAPLIALPQYGMIIIFTFMFTFDLSGIIMNITLCVRLRRSRRVRVQNISIRSVPGNDAGQSRVRHPMHPTTRELEQPSSSKQRCPVEVIENTPAFVSRSTLFIQRPGTKNKPTKIKTMLFHDTGYDSESQSFSGNYNGSKAIKNMSANMRKSDLSTLKICQRTEHHEQSPKTTDTTQPRVSSTPRNKSSPNNIPSSNREVAVSNNTRLRNLSVTMIIIALWCSMLNLPFLMFMLYMCVLTGDRTNANYNIYGVMATTLLSINALGDPLIYAWRFIDWSSVCMRIRLRCCCKCETRP